MTLYSMLQRTRTRSLSATCSLERLKQSIYNDLLKITFITDKVDLLSVQGGLLKLRLHIDDLWLWLVTGFVYGAKKGKGLNVFIDDLSIPQQDQHGVQEVNEVKLSA